MTAGDGHRARRGRRRAAVATRVGRRVFSHHGSHGAQLWVALPDGERLAPRGFVLHEPAPVWLAARRPERGSYARVFVGSLGRRDRRGRGRSRRGRPFVGAELTPHGGEGRRRLPLEAAYEHVLVPLPGRRPSRGRRWRRGRRLFLGVDRSSSTLALDGGRAGAAARWRALRRGDRHVVELRRPQPRRDRPSAIAWNAGGDDRFGEVAHYPTDERLAAPPLPNVRLQPRGRVSARSSP